MQLPANCVLLINERTELNPVGGVVCTPEIVIQ